jgi:hypothetical protein
MILKSLEVDPKAFEARTGWAIKPEGACKGDVCVALPAGVAGAAKLDARMLSERLGMPLVHDADADVWSLGPEVLGGGRALTTARAPELTLPDYKGNQFELSSLLGQKAIIVSWSSW